MSMSVRVSVRVSVCVFPIKKKLVDWFGDIVPCHDIEEGPLYQQFAASGIT